MFACFMAGTAGQAMYQLGLGLIALSAGLWLWKRR